MCVCGFVRACACVHVSVFLINLLWRWVGVDEPFIRVCATYTRAYMRFCWCASTAAVMEDFNLCTGTRTPGRRLLRY